MLLAPKAKLCQPKLPPKRRCALRDGNRSSLGAIYMKRHLTPRALKRAQWIKDLASALGEAEKLLAILETSGGLPVETKRLRDRVQAVRTEVDMLNRVMIGGDRVVGQSWPERAPIHAAEC